MKFASFRSNSFVGCFIVWLIIFFFFYRTTSHSDKKTSDKTEAPPVTYPERQNKLFVEAFHCLEEGLDQAVDASHRGKFKQVYRSLGDLINTCSAEAKNSLPLLKIRNQDEAKYFLSPVVNAEGCNIVTLGIGRDIDAELELKRRYPHCTFLGADPDAAISGNMFEKQLGGKFVETAIAKDDGILKASIINKDNGSYHEETIRHMAFSKFISQYNGFTAIDMMFIDVEGAEFEMLEYMVQNINEFPVICQMNIEFHFPEEHPPLGNNILENLQKMTKSGRFLMLFVEPCGPFYRVYLLNVKDEKCVQSYFGNMGRK